MDSTKPHFTPDYQEFETRDTDYQRTVQTARLVESVRLGLTTLVFLAGLTIVGTSADTLSVYNTTTTPRGDPSLLSLWPNEFDIRPTIALVTCGAIVSSLSFTSLLVSKLPPIRNHRPIQTSVLFLNPVLCLVSALIGTSFFYGVNASNKKFSMQAWSCQWSSIDMNIKPHWGTLCRESKAALYLLIIVIPLEFLVFMAAAWAAFTEKKQIIARGRKGSPAMS